MAEILWRQQDPYNPLLAQLHPHRKRLMMHRKAHGVHPNPVEHDSRSPSEFRNQ
jgi:hypothetical protein